MGSAARHVLHEALLWGAIVLGGCALIYFFDDLRAALDPNALIAQQKAEVPAEPCGVRQSFGGEVRLKSDGRGHFVMEGYVNDLHGRHRSHARIPDL